MIYCFFGATSSSSDSELLRNVPPDSMEFDFVLHTPYKTKMLVNYDRRFLKSELSWKQQKSLPFVISSFMYSFLVFLPSFTTLSRAPYTIYRPRQHSTHKFIASRFTLVCRFSYFFCWFFPTLRFSMPRHIWPSFVCELNFNTPHPTEL